MSEATEHEVRCPNGPQRLMAKTISRGEEPQYVQPDNLIEFACFDCRRIRRQQGEKVQMVLHRFNIIGEHVETIVK